MKRLVPETLGKSIFRRYNRMTRPPSFKRSGWQSGYTRAANPLVWRTAQAAPDTGSLSSLWRSRRSAFPQLDSTEDDLALSALPPAQPPPEAASSPLPASPAALERPLKVQRKAASPARRTAVELPGSTPLQQAPQAGKAASAPASAGVPEQARTPPAAPARKGVSRKSEKKGGSPTLDSSAPRPQPLVGGRSERTRQPADLGPELPARPGSGPKPRKIESAVSAAKPSISPQTGPDAPVLFGRRLGKKPGAARLNRRPAWDARDAKREADPPPPRKPSGAAGAKPDPALHEPASSKGETRVVPAQPPAQPGSGPLPGLRRKPIKAKLGPQTASPARGKRASRAVRPGPVSPQPATQPGVPPEPPRSAMDETPLQPLKAPALLKTPKPLVQSLGPGTVRPLSGPVASNSTGQNPPGPGPEHRLPALSRPSAPEQALPPSPVDSAASAGSLRFAARPQVGETPQENVLSAKPAEPGISRQKEPPVLRSFAASPARGEVDPGLPPPQFTPSASPLALARKPETLPPQVSRPAPSRLQRQIGLDEAPASPPSQGMSSPIESPASLSDSGAGAENKPQESAKALDEMARQVYEILQRRLRAEFERSHGWKI
jgi:hypothetical protein